MSLDEIIVSVFGAILGYWIISNLISKSQHTTNQKANFQQTNASFSSSTNTFEWFIILGVNENASNSDIQSAYRNLIEKYHPDKIAHLGESFQQLAHQKTLEINDAYKVVQKLRGIEF